VSGHTRHSPHSRYSRTSDSCIGSIRSSRIACISTKPAELRRGRHPRGTHPTVQRAGWRRRGQRFGRSTRVVAPRSVPLCFRPTHVSVWWIEELAHISTTPNTHPHSNKEPRKMETPVHRRVRRRNHAGECPIGFEQILDVGGMLFELGLILHEPCEQLQQNGKHMLDDLELDRIEGRAVCSIEIE
jgi:hypothetical protein